MANYDNNFITYHSKIQGVVLHKLNLTSTYLELAILFQQHVFMEELLFSSCLVSVLQPTMLQSNTLPLLDVLQVRTLVC
jgi:hypothetical protein